MDHHYLGEFEELVLLAICGLSREAYAVSIHQRLIHVARRHATLGGVYRTLSRLGKKGYVHSWMGAVTHEQGGKRKRLYEVTALGKQVLLDMQAARGRLRDGLDLSPALSPN